MKKTITIAITLVLAFACATMASDKICTDGRSDSSMNGRWMIDFNESDTAYVDMYDDGSMVLCVNGRGTIIKERQWVRLWQILNVEFFKRMPPLLKQPWELPDSK